MNSFVVYEALTVGFKEGLKIGVVWLVFYSYLILNNKKSLIIPFYSGVFLALLFSSAPFLLPQTAAVKEYLSNFIAMSFAFFLISSAAALFHASGTNLLGPLKGAEVNAVVMHAVVFLLTFMFFYPDGAGTVIFLKDLSLMKDARLPVYASAVSGLLIAAGLFFAISKFFMPYRLGSFFNIPQMLLFLAMVKLLGGGIKGFAELSLIPSVQRGFMKFMHDFIHQTFVMLMVPDHPILKTTTWNFIGFFFRQAFSSAASLFILLFFPLMFIYYSLLKPLPEPEAHTGSERRMVKYMLLSDKRKKALPVIFFICLILFAWFSQKGESVSRLYNPKPRPVVEDIGVVAIPLNDPAIDLMDGTLHKFSLTHQAEEIRIMIIKKSDNSLVVCLDACDICPPEGYGQSEGHVVCINCNSPVSIDALGRPGGCNPVPLSVSVDERFVRIEMSEILKKWKDVKTGKGKEAVK